MTPDMTVLVTGATGFVGSAVVRKLRDRGEDVRALVRENSDRRNVDGLGLELVTGDLGDPASLAAAVKGCNTLYHVAADYRIWVRDPDEMRKTNVDGTRNLLLAAAETGVSRIVYTSSVAALGKYTGGALVDEETPVVFENLVGPYKKSKYLAEEEVRRLIRDEGIPVVIVNPAAPVGPRDIRPTPTGRMILEAASGHMRAYVDTGMNIVHVDDVAEGHLLAFDKGEIGERYILGGENMALKEILTQIAVIAGLKPPLFRVPTAVVMPVAFIAETWARLTNGKEPLVTLDGVRMAQSKMYYSSDKAKTALGYRPRPAVEALTDAIAWFRANGYCR
jgi:dihydroflavonol-4-reductase